MRPDDVLLLCGGLLDLARQLVLQGGHRNIHGQGGMHQAVAFSQRQIQFHRDEVAQDGADE